VTFFQALKANETQRVRQVGDTPGYAPEKLIACLEQNMLDIDACNRRSWEVVEEPKEFWVGILENGTICSSGVDSKEKARGLFRPSSGWKYVTLVREVPGTREEVKP
jgi:hypothetical protein